MQNAKKYTGTSADAKHLITNNEIRDKNRKQKSKHKFTTLP